MGPVCLAPPMTEPVRLSKRVAELAGCSRSEAEQYVQGGWVRVDGIVVEEPQFKVTDQQVALDPEARLEAAEPATFILHKPSGLPSAEAVAVAVPASRWEEDPERLARAQAPFRAPGRGDAARGRGQRTAGAQPGRPRDPATDRGRRQAGAGVHRRRRGRTRPLRLEPPEPRHRVRRLAGRALQGQLAERAAPALRDQGRAARDAAAPVRGGRAARDLPAPHPSRPHTALEDWPARPTSARTSPPSERF